MTDTLPSHPHLGIPQLMAVARGALSPARLAYLEELERQYGTSPPRVPGGKASPRPRGAEDAIAAALRAARRLCKRRPEYSAVLLCLEAAAGLLPAARRGKVPDWARPDGGGVRQLTLWAMN